MARHPFLDALIPLAGDAAAGDIAQAVETYTPLTVTSVDQITTRDLDRTFVVLLISGESYFVYRYDPDNTDEPDGLTVIHDSADRPFVRAGTTPGGGFAPKGAYDGETTYELLDLVTDQGGSWVYLNETAGSGNAPPTLPTVSNTHWQLVAAPGEQGPAGEDFAPDEVVALIAGRAAFDDEAKGFSVLIEADENNDDLPTLYFKLSATSADWSGGFTFSGGSGSSTAVNVGGNVLTPHEGLVCKYVSATTVDIDAGALLLKDSSGNAVRVESTDLTVDITGSGANGLDTGIEANSTWYHLWAIYNPDIEAVAGLLSASATAPTLPSGYTYKGYVGAVYNDSSGNLATFLQIGNEATTEIQTIVAAGTDTNYTDVDLTAFVPPTAKAAGLRLQPSSSSGTNIVSVFVAPAGSGTTATYGVGIYEAGTFDSIGILFGPIFCLTSTPQHVFYRVSGTNARTQIAIMGWRF